MASTEETDPSAPVPSEATGAPECVACQNRMNFVTVILDPRTPGRVRLFECKECQNTVLIRE